MKTCIHFFQIKAQKFQSIVSGIWSYWAASCSSWTGLKSPSTCSRILGGEGNVSVWNIFYWNIFESEEFKNLVGNQKLLIKSEHLRRMKNEIILPGYKGWPKITKILPYSAKVYRRFSEVGLTICSTACEQERKSVLFIAAGTICLTPASHRKPHLGWFTSLQTQ